MISKSMTNLLIVKKKKLKKWKKIKKPTFIQKLEMKGNKTYKKITGSGGGGASGAF